MSDRKDDNTPAPRKLGTLSSLLASSESSNSFQRLKSLRTVPSTTSQKEFVPNVAVRRAPKKEEDLDKRLPGPIPTLLQTSLENNDARKGPQIPGGQKRPERKMNFSMPSLIGTSVSSGGGPFASGPPQQDKQKKSSIGTVLQEDRNADFEGGVGISSEYSGLRKLKKVNEISPTNPNHPTMIPYSDDARQDYLKSLSEQEDPIFQDLTNTSFLNNKEMCILQLPSELPIIPNVTEKEEDTKPNNSNSETSHISSISNVGEGQIGKLKVYKSGKVRLQIGTYLYDIIPGTECSFLQQIMVVSPDTKQCYQLGNLHKQFICIPDFEKLL